jgi:hypothetical protein
MKIKFYSSAISYTSLILNLCIRNGWWKMVDIMLKLRKNYLAKEMRQILSKI